MQSESEGRHYPVFYLNDGQNLFDPATAYIGVDWQVDETAARLVGEGKVPPLIIVGIDHAQKDRAREYLPYRSMNPPVFRPQGKHYPDFLLNEVMPFCLPAIPHRQRSGKYRPRRIIAGGNHFSVHRDGPARKLWPPVVGEPVLIRL